MPEASPPIKTCVAGASALVELCKTEEAEEIFQLAYEAALTTNSKSDSAFALSALANFLCSDNRPGEADLLQRLHNKTLPTVKRAS